MSRDTTPQLLVAEDLPLFCQPERPATPASPPPAEPPTPGLGADQPDTPRTLAELVNRAYPDPMHELTLTNRDRRAMEAGQAEILLYGDRYQNGVRPGPKKFAQFIECLRLQNTPKRYSQDGLGDAAVVHVKLFDPCGSATWWLTEWSHDPKDLVAFGLCFIHEAELGPVDLRELSEIRGQLGIGIEVDMHFQPRSLREVLAETG